MNDRTPIPPSGRFRWNAGGWFGSQIGSTAWLLVGAAVLAPHAPDVSAIWLAGFAVANVLGTWLWRRRDRIRPYPAVQVLLLACGAVDLLALVALHRLRPGLRVASPPGFWIADEPRFIPLFSVLFLGLMGLFHLMERAARKERHRARS